MMGSRSCGRRIWLLSVLTVVMFLGVVAQASAGTVKYWTSIQPTGNASTNIPLIIRGSCVPDGKTFVSSSAKLFVDGALVPRSSYSASISSNSVYFYYNFLPPLTDGPHTFRVEVADTAGKISSNQWSATIVQPPKPSWLSPAAGSIVYDGRPKISLSLADNTPDTTFSVEGEVHWVSALGPVVATFGGTGLSAGQNTFALPAELPPGSYYLTARITDAAGNAATLSGSSARAFLALPAPAMGLLEECDGCHAAYRDVHPTPPQTDCLVCHEGYGDDHMEGTEYCEDCHYEGWHADNQGQVVAVTSSCISCHTTGRPTVPTHTAENTAPAHMSSCDGCHVGTLTEAHSGMREDSAYAYQCDLCHASGADPEVAAAVAAGDTSCSACHADSAHGDISLTHSATSEASLACAAEGCHYSADTVGIHSERVEGGCAVCHNNPTSGNLTEGKTSKDCEGCHATAGVDYHLNMAVHITPVADYESCGHCHHAWGSSPLKGPDVTRHAGGCATCHNATLDLSGLTTSCASCHNEEGVDYHYETAVRHTPVDQGSLDCARCHETTDVRALHAEPGCDTCHTNYTCGECHNMHNGEPGTPLLSGLSCSVNCHTTEGTDYHSGFGVSHTNSTMDSGCLAAGCHSNSLVDAHSAYVGAGSRYPQYADTCELCHLNEVAGRIPSDATADCSTCHGQADHEALHEVSRTDECAECHAGATLTTVHGTTPSATCVTCHQSTDPQVVAAIDGHQRTCESCHDTEQPHGDDVLTHTATLGSGSVRVFEYHEGWSQIDYVVDCSMCHTNNLSALHADQCSTCHPTPRDTFASWSKGCQQGGCHTQIHAGADAAHQNVYDTTDCETYCHNSDWSVPLENCFFCHTSSDAVAPTSYSNAKSSYVGPARIDVWASDPYPTSGIRGSFYTVDGGPITAGSIIDVPPPALGSAVHMIEYWSADNGGNVETPRKSALITVTADVTAPISSSNAVSAYIGPATMTLSATDNGTAPWGLKAIHYRVDDGPESTGTSVVVPQPAAGTESHTLQFWAEDWSGNVEQPKTVTFTITADTTAPQTTSNAQPYYNTSSSIRITFTATDVGGSGVAATYYKLNGGPTYSGTMTGYIYNQGTYTLEYWSVDKAGNVETPHKVQTFVRDWTKPVTTSNAQTGYVGSATITLTPTDSGSGIAATYYRLDGGAQTAGTTVSVTEPGSHTLLFWSVDKAGNVELQKTANFTVAGSDSVAPVTTSSLNPAAGTIYTSNQTVTLTALDNTGGSGVKTTYYRIDAGVWRTGTSFTVSGEGLHTFSYYSVDNANNTETTRVSNQFRIDTVAPSTTCSAANGATYSGDQTFTLSASDAGSGIASTWYRIDGGTWTAGTSIPVSAPAAGSASHTIYWYSIDNAGRQESVKSVTFSVASPSAGIATLAFRWHPYGWAEANLHVENAAGDIIASTWVSGTGEDLDWLVQVPIGQSYYLSCDFYYDEDYDDEGGGYGIWKDVTTSGATYEWWY